jgi:hypothetical protein
MNQHGHRNTPRAQYTAEVIGGWQGMLAITDLNRPGCRSVTNDIEAVLAELTQQYGMDLPVTIIYRDTEGMWDGIAHLHGTFRGFYPIREVDRERAIAKAKKLRAGPQP